MPNIFPPNSFKYDFEFSIQTCWLQKGWVIDRSVNEPPSFQLLIGLLLRLVPKLRCFSSRRMFFSADDDLDGAPTAEDGTSTCMSVLPREEELLVERNDAARLSLLTNLLIFL